jgi:hypothetical protein
MQTGVDEWEAAGFLRMSVEMLDRVYGHHHPQHLHQAAQSIEYRRQNKTLAVSLARAKPADSDVAQTIDIVAGPGRTRTCNQTILLPFIAVVPLAKRWPRSRTAPRIPTGHDELGLSFRGKAIARS